MPEDTPVDTPEDTQLLQTTSIILIGVQHVGKSTVGAMLSQKLHIPLIDIDALILAQSPQYNSIRTLYHAIGKNEFHALEYKVLEYQACNMISAPCIVSTGGGIAENTRALEILRSPQYLKIQLTASPDIVWNRIIKQGIPAYLNATLSTMPIHTIPQHDIDAMKEKFILLVTKRQAIYTAIANHNISTIDRTIAKTIDNIVDEIIVYVHALHSNV